ncbi:fimbria/pilus periplasmic chaperone [Rhodanobacter sp. AS-Z3]|uniref:fimbrial biogenesis chaperone n=1 Tax=Rhodanobacter sp. AS-Z3 TaxID=3031330 RepID=UPI00247AB65B|nr:fimbria/pilus periplasmic chaperone [Rhodanobacter sp. AS-Z3]WEN15216.1 fimbria/pilus periplasmic chaperone [Rhodanobacter sp. AS-Z3]
MKSLLCAMGAALIVLSTFVGSSHASVVIAGTRVVFPAANGEVTVRLNNQGNAPALVEAWIDSGNPDSTPDTSHVPFLVTPPLARMNPGNGQSLRIVYTGQSLPSDRESLFWLNVLEIPPKPVTKPGEEQNTLQFAVRSRLKLFFRPAGLASDAAHAAEQITWSVVADGAGYALEARNPTPYHITISQLSLNVDKVAYALGSGMVAPRSSLRMPIKNLGHAPAAGTPIAFTTIDDFGAVKVHEGNVAP